MDLHLYRLVGYEVTKNSVVKDYFLLSIPFKYFYHHKKTTRMIYDLQILLNKTNWDFHSNSHSRIMDEKKYTPLTLYLSNLVTKF